MPLTTIPNVKTWLGINQADTSQDPLFNLLISQADSLIYKYLDRWLWQNNYTEYYNGNGVQQLALNQRPITIIQTIASLVQGSTSISVPNLGPNIDQIIDGMPVSGGISPEIYSITPGSVVDGYDITSDSIVLSLPALSTGLFPITFGIAVWQDQNQALWGQNIGSFAENTQLICGQDYAVQIDKPIVNNLQQSESGLIYRYRGPWLAPYAYSPGWISPNEQPGAGNIMVQYTAGFVSMPPELELAVLGAIAKVYNLRTFGQTLKSESDEVYSYTLLDADKSALNIAIFSPEVLSVLALFKGPAVG